MIELAHFQINIFSIFILILLLILIFLKKIDLLSILAFTSSFYNLVLFNYKPWTFGFQIFFFFAIIFIIFSLKNLGSNLTNKNNLRLLAPVFIFLIVVLLGEIVVYFNPPTSEVVRFKETEVGAVKEQFKFSRINITQFLYLIFYLMLFLCIAFKENLEFLKIFKFYLFGLNLNFLFQLFEILYFRIYQSLPKFLMNLSFFPDVIQKVYLKNFEFYRISGLLPAPSLLGIYLFVGLLILILFKEKFSRKFYFTQLFVLTLSGLIGFSVTFLLSFVVVLSLLTLKEKKYFLIPILLFLLFLTLSTALLKTSFKLRIENALFSLKIFREYPILGIGFGSHFSDDLLTTLLATTGILGSSFFVLIFLLPFIQSLKIKNELLLQLSQLNLMPLILILLIWHGFTINIFWIILGAWYNKLIKCS